MMLLIIVLVVIQKLEAAAEPTASRPTCSTGARPLGRPGWPPPSATDGQQRSVAIAGGQRTFTAVSTGTKMRR